MNSIYNHPSLTPASFLLMPYNFVIVNGDKGVHSEGGMNPAGVTSVKPIHVSSFDEIGKKVKELYPAAERIEIESIGDDFYEKEKIHFAQSLGITIYFSEISFICISVDCFSTINAIEWMKQANPKSIKVLGWA